MNSVKIKDIYYDGEVDSSEEVKNIEVVPRKMVEMIIEKCKDHASGPKPSGYIAGVSDEAICIAQYAISLLQQFEGNDFSNTEKCLVEPLPFD